MAKTIAKRKRVVRRDWTRTEIKELRQHSKDKTRVQVISKALKRTPGALRQKGSCARNSAWPSAYQEKASLNFWRPDRIQELPALQVYFRRPCSFYAANHVPWRANLQASSTILPIKSW